IEEAITQRGRSLVQFAQVIIKSLVGLSVVQISLDIGHSIGQPLPCFGIQLVKGGFPIGTNKALYGVGKPSPPVLGCLRSEVHADDPEFVRQTLRTNKVVERGDDQALRQIACGAENDHGTRRRERRTIRSSKGRIFSALLFRAAVDVRSGSTD